MANPDATATTPMSLWKWSPAEKIVAHRAFDVALKRELETVIRKAKERAERIKEPSDLWEMEDWLAEQRRRIDRTFDFRYSVLPLVFATLIRTRGLDEEELSGLAQEKLDTILHIAHM